MNTQQTISRYIPQTGEILGPLHGLPEILELNRKMFPGEYIDGEFYPDTHYVKEGSAVPRPEMEIMVEGLQISNIPVPAQLYINHASYVVESSTVEISIDQPGQYTILIESWPYLPKEFSIENPPQ